MYFERGKHGSERGWYKPTAKKWQGDTSLLYHTPVLKESMKDELRSKIHSIAFVAKKSECLDLPETTEIIRKIELEPSAMNTYKHLVRDSFAELQNSEVTVTNVLTKILRLSQLTGGFR